MSEASQLRKVIEILSETFAIVAKENIELKLKVASLENSQKNYIRDCVGACNTCSIAPICINAYK